MSGASDGRRVTLPSLHQAPHGQECLQRHVLGWICSRGNAWRGWRIPLGTAVIQGNLSQRLHLSACSRWRGGLFCWFCFRILLALYTGGCLCCGLHQRVEVNILCIRVHQGVMGGALERMSVHSCSNSANDICTFCFNSFANSSSTPSSKNKSAISWML